MIKLFLVCFLFTQLGFARTSFDIIRLSEQTQPASGSSLEGDLIYNSATSSIQFIDSSGDWLELNDLEYFKTTNGDCAASPCTITQKSKGILSVTRGGAGNYTVNFNANTFSGKVLCVFNAGRGGSRMCSVSTPDGSCDVSSCAISCVNTSTTAAQDADPHGFCRGDR